MRKQRYYDETGDATCNLLAGTTEKMWRRVAIKGNASYTGGGVDVPRPASLKKTSNTTISFSCGAAETIVMRYSGTFNYRGLGGVSWVLSGSTVTLDISRSAEPPVASATPTTMAAS